VSPQGKQLDRHNVRRRRHEPAVKAAGLSPALRLHDLRHTAATLWLSAGESIYFAQQQLGHRDFQTTIDLYGHPDQATHREAAARAASWWRESGTTERYHGPVEVLSRRQESAARAPSE
jgi:integrase